MTLGLQNLSSKSKENIIISQAIPPSQELTWSTLQRNGFFAEEDVNVSYMGNFNNKTTPCRRLHIDQISEIRGDADNICISNNENYLNQDSNTKSYQNSVNYIRFIPNEDFLHTIGSDEEMKLAVELISEVLKIRDEWVIQWPSIQDENTGNNFNFLNKKDVDEDKNQIYYNNYDLLLENTPDSIDIKYEMIKGVFCIKWITDKNLLYNPGMIKKIKKSKYNKSSNTMEYDWLNTNSDSAVCTEKTEKCYKKRMEQNKIKNCKQWKYKERTLCLSDRLISYKCTSDSQDDTSPNRSIQKINTRVFDNKLPIKLINNTILTEISKPFCETKCKSVSKFLECMRKVMTLVQNPIVKSYTYHRLKYLAQSYQLYTMFNGKTELEEGRNNMCTGFHNIYKVDTHVHHSACMSQKHLLKFIRKCFDRDGDEYVTYDENTCGKKTLREIFEQVVGIGKMEASIDNLNMQSIGHCFQRFDRFKEKYNPFGSNIFREIFLKYDNMINGRYLAELTQEVMQDLKETKCQFAEWRISIYGKDMNEWQKLSEWLYKNRLYCSQVKWLIQVPRLYHVFYAEGKVSNFAEMLNNIFLPLIKALETPKRYPLIYLLLKNIVGWDSVDDESVQSKYTMVDGDLNDPEFWNNGENPPYAYWGFYMYSNINVINQLMYSRGLKPMKYRPHCGEAGNISHLATMYILADAINHGILLKKSPVLQYLYYLKQIGIAISPVSNNALFLEITKNPFPKFFYVGLNVSLSTDDPLIFHFTDEPLLEEYSIAAHIWKFSSIDLCEVARNSVLQSGFSSTEKANWIGVKKPNYLNYAPHKIICKFDPVYLNDIYKSNVPNIRLQFRRDMLLGEFNLIERIMNDNILSNNCSHNNSHVTFQIPSNNQKIQSDMDDNLSSFHSSLIQTSFSSSIVNTDDDE
ncbi:adenosine monophosphate deaminase, putative [Cryptosporidium muris RN66]|uniref:AMP deaminase n=1 Tax=Cryptosporidium muris (strain RN66) TaxID=441375 RepID=B6AIG7_CRYMR|nr:adenosine monophosphate deaminase, putative [Cryptosporidium muris RN66]EEA08008.1 adenosine monophosphate deaminase, putative [Cryptosporidium muris RN66]|eukprot:XP_002142357.1 adenosine monophosphate deaminase [Cryptosporidium muris RN66]